MAQGQLKNPLIKNCIFCGRQFHTRSPVAKCCNEECSNLRRKEQVGQYYHNHKRERGIYNKNWQKENTERRKLKRRELKSSNPDKYKNQFKEWYYKNHESQKKRVRDYRSNNPDKVRNTFKNWYDKKRKEDINYKILLVLRSRIGKLLKYKSISKYRPTIKLLGCIVPELKLHLEKQFKPGMTWNNHGRYGWHIDHIVPCASFDLSDTEQQKKCFHYTNLQPLWAKENLMKGAKFEQAS